MFDDIARRAGATPTIERARQRLGGTGATDARAGVTMQDASGVVGVVLYANGDDVDLVVGAAGVVRRSSAKAWTAVAVAPDDLAAVADDIVAFARLEVGDSVSFRDGDRLDDGLLFEKCRYGALVARADGTIVAVGFRNVRRRDPTAPPPS